MTITQKISAYQAILDGINAAMDRVDVQMSTLLAEYENLKRLNEAVSGDMVTLVASMDSTAARS